MNRWILIVALVTSLALADRSPAVAAEDNQPFTTVVSGIDGAMKENVEAMLVTPQGMIRDGRVEPTWARRFARLAEGRVKRALQPFGYYEPDIQISLQTLETGNYRLDVAITPGPPVRVAARNIQLRGPGADNPRLQRQVDAFPLSESAIFRHDLYEEGKGQLRAKAFALGYIKAAYSHHAVTINLETRQADIDLHLDTGEKHFFGSVRFVGAENFPPSTLRRHLAFAEGQPFDRTRLARTQANLLDTDKFRNVRIMTGEAEATDSRVPITIELDPRPRYQLRPGVGYGTDTGARGSLRFRDNNVFHLGHEFLADLLIAERKQSISGNYLIPLAQRPESLMAFSVEYERDNNDSYDSDSLSTEARVTHGLPKGFKLTYYLKLLREDYEIGDDPSRVATLVMPGVRLGQSKWQLEKPGRVRSGYTWQVETRGSSVNLGSDVSSLQGLLGGNTILPLADKWLLILRAEAGTTLQDEFDDLPPSLRFFAGGDQSVRGYAYESLGPQDAQGEVIGGRHLLIGSVEIETAVTSDWSVAAFYDAGNAFDNVNDFDFAQGAGIGLRRYTPIGPIKVDLARQLNNDRDYRLHLSVGFGW